MICAIVLAAGQSRRMGRPKMLLPFGHKTLIAHVVDQIIPAVDQTIVVTPIQTNIADALGDRPVTMVPNPKPDGDMLSSVRCGLRALPNESRAVLIAIGDQPAITTTLITEMIRALDLSNRTIIIPIHQGRRGHPLLFSAIYRDEILTRFDDTGLRGLLQSHPTDFFELPCPTDSILSDMDTPEDYQRELQRMNSLSPKRRREDLATDGARLD
jgi:molybdenum cofactor cytidylyltransferase